MRALVLPIVLTGLLAGCGSSESEPTGPPPPPETVTGTLADGDAVDDGSYSDAYTLQLRKGQFIEANVRTDDFTPYLFVDGPNGDGDGQGPYTSPGGTQQARVSFEATRSGRWTVEVSSLDEGETGAYELTYGVVDLAFPDTTDTEMMEMLNDIESEFESVEP